MRGLILVCMFLGVVGSAQAAPSYGTKLPQKNRFNIGAQAHVIFKRYLENEQGRLKSTQYFFLLSYGLTEWLAVDLKSASGNIKQHPHRTDGVDYPSSFAGGYGFRLKFLDRQKLKAVFGFQHISVHPHSVHLGPDKHKAILDDWQCSLLGSYQFKHITSYLGTRWSRLDYIHWNLNQRKRTMSDLTKSIGLIVGMDIPLAEKIWLNIEGQCFDSEAVALSINYSF